MNDAVLAVSGPISQATIAAPVLLPALLPEPFDYLIPEGTLEGTLVEAPLAGRTLIGVVWKRGRIFETSPTAGSPIVPSKKKAFTLKSVTRVIDTVPPLRQPFRDWLDWIAEFTLAPKGAVLSLCGLAHAAKVPKRPWKAMAFTVKLPTLTEPQAEVAQTLVETLACSSRSTGDAKDKPILLDGVTGSGKTEVYFHAIAAAMESWNACGQAGQVLVLLPEIALTHQWLERFEKTFGVPPVLWHSRMTPAAKARAWQAVARGEVPVVVGARSALFLPFANLQLIVVDEEHDPSYKQEDGVLYHARDMAVVRARFEGIPIILASATPSLETLENVREGKYQALHLPERFGAAGLPTVRLVDMRIDAPERGDFLSPVIKRELLATLARGEQVLLFLNRRGYAPLLLCRKCGHRFQCANCSAWLTVHGTRKREQGLGIRDQGLGKESKYAKTEEANHQTPFLTPDPWALIPTSLHCHHCGHREPMPPACPACKADKELLAPCGPGVERIAEEVRAMFGSEGSGIRDQGSVGYENASSFLTPDPCALTPKIAVLSSDESIAADTWANIEAGKIDIIVGTQMVAKGHHFPRLTFVGVVDADVGLSGADLRAGERTYQMLHQLGGRAGRGELPGKVYIQTYAPEHPVMQSLKAQDRDRLMALEAKERKAGGWPPFGQLAAILLDGVDEANVRAAGQQLAQSAPVDARLTVLGPAPAPLSRLRGQFRYRLLVKAKPGIHLQRTLRNWLDGQKFSGVRVKIDVNPYYFL